MNIDEQKEQKKWKRKITQYNPHYVYNVKKYWKTFFKLLRKHFLQSHSFSGILQKNTVKLSYSGTRNAAAGIMSQNQNVLNLCIENSGCNCEKKQNCPLDIKYQTPSIIYDAKVTNDKHNDEKNYLGLCETPFQERYNNHTKYFRNEAFSKDAELLNMFGC